MATKPILPFDVWPPGSTQPSIPVNDNALRSEILCGLVLSKTTTAQPVSPADGAIYILPAGRTGAQWALFAVNDLVIHYGGTWYAFGPVEGVRVDLPGGPQQYVGGAWVASTLWAPYSTTLTDAAASDDLPPAGVATALTALLQSVRNQLKALADGKFDKAGGTVTGAVVAQGGAQLGESGSALKTKTLTGVLPAVGVAQQVGAHGLDRSKIAFWRAVMRTNDDVIEANTTDSTGARNSLFGVYIQNSNVTALVHPDATNAAGKSFEVTIFYRP